MTHERFEGERTLMRIHIGECDKWRGKPLYQALIELFRKESLAGCTVLRGVEGYGSSHRPLSSVKNRLSLDLCCDLPLVVEVVENPERIEEVLPRIKEMVTGGLITLEKARVILYRSHD
jgi:uncharacterized protein